MRLNRYYAPTLKETPAEAEVLSHKLLLRAGYIRKLTAGVYTYLPLALRTLNKISTIIREEMDRAGAHEILMPAVQPADLWKESGRWDHYGKELLRFVDRHNRSSCLGPTHEEVVTDLIRHEVRSYRQLPLNLYQIQTKFRDEIRPRFGLMRGREFIMKDGYSFDMDDAGADNSYWKMYDAYVRIFTRLGLKFRAVAADSGSIGGSFSHEFMVLAETGEDILVACDECSYGANLEKAETPCPQQVKTASCPGAESFQTPGIRTIQEMATYLDVPLTRIIKTAFYIADGSPVAALVRGDRDLNEVKLKNAINATDLRLASAEEVETLIGTTETYGGPVRLAAAKCIADHELLAASDWFAGANEQDTYLRHIDLDRDADITGFVDLRQVAPGDICPNCGGRLTFTKGIEIGHVFKLGTKYSQAMNASFLDESGKEQPFVMGCYGIGVSRILAACIEQNNDAAGIVFPPPIAPFEVVLLNLNPTDRHVRSKAESIYNELTSLGVEVLLDDRDERIGVKFNEADLWGFPLQLVLGSNELKNGLIGTKDRRTGEKAVLPLEDFMTAFMSWRSSVRTGWGIKK